MNPFEFKRFIPIAKIDDEERMVYGFASTPDLDSDGEIISLDAIKKALPGYLQFPTIREMHQPKAAGTTKNAEVREGKKEKGLYIGAKVVAEDAWNLVKEGVYLGFSIGGHVLKKVGNVIEELELVEISLVDVPANKQAKIEVWKSDKRGGESGVKIEKNANTVYSLTSLMGHCQDVMAYFDYLGKDTKKLGKMLEQCKSMIANEAMEPEADKPEGGDDMMMSASADALKTRITSLEKMDFGDNKVANLLREEVIKAMKTKADELNKESEAPNSSEAEEPKAPVENVEGEEEKEEGQSNSEETGTEGEEENKAPEGEGSEETPASDEKEEEEEKETPEGEESKEGEEENGEEEKSESPTLTKLEKIEKSLEEQPKATEKVEENSDLAKSVNKMVDILQKVSDSLTDIKGRVEKLESQPAPLKSKAAFIKKAIDNGEESPSEEKVSNSKEVEAKKARLAELNKKFDELGANAFAKQGFSLEAGKLQNEIAQLEAQAS